MYFQIHCCLYICLLVTLSSNHERRKFMLLSFPVASRPNAGQSLLVLEVSRSYTTTHHSRQDSAERVISSSQQALPDNINSHNRHIAMYPAIKKVILLCKILYPFCFFFHCFSAFDLCSLPANNNHTCDDTAWMV